MPADTEKKDLELQVRRILNAPRERVFQAWTDARQMSQWFRPRRESSDAKVEMDARPGGAYSITVVNAQGQSHTARGVFKEVRPPERLVFTWQLEGKTDLPGAELETLVTVELHDRGGKTELVLTHQRFVAEETVQRHTHGWAGCLEALGGYLVKNS